jgi:tetratricopeptide (TPR) repeat protein
MPQATVASSNLSTKSRLAGPELSNTVSSSQSSGVKLSFTVFFYRSLRIIARLKGAAGFLRSEYGTRPTSKSAAQANPRPNLLQLLRRALRARETGALAKAERLYNAALQFDPGNFDALHGLGLVHYQRGQLDTAVVLFQTALKHDGARSEGFSSLGLMFHLLRRFDDALTSYDAGLSLAPGDTQLLNRRGVVLLELRRPREAIADFGRVLAADPDNLDARGNYGNGLLKLNRPEEALAAYDRALAALPENPQLLTNRAVALRRLDRPQEAVMSASRALVAKPDFAQARFVESVARLTLGDFHAGWRGYESRWSVGFLATQRRGFTAPLWLGPATPNISLEGKTILLHAEQGFGDSIQFVRYARLVAGCGAKKIIVEVQRELARLFSAIPFIDAVIPRGERLPPFDCHCPLLSLPLAFATELATIPAETSYLAANDEDTARWRARLPARRPLVGVAWSGERSHDNDLNRSLQLETLLPLLDLPHITFVSLQHAVREEDAEVLHSRANIVRIGQEFRDFADTAAAIAGMDAVISTDTAVAHLAGAMGKPLFLLLPFAADFRWLRERPDSPWYPTALLYRQPKFGDWKSVVETLCRRLGHDIQRRNTVTLPAAEKLSA